MLTSRAYCNNCIVHRIILDSDLSEECNDFTMMWFFFLELFSTRNLVPDEKTTRTFFCSILDLIGAPRTLFFDFSRALLIIMRKNGNTFKITVFCYFGLCFFLFYCTWVNPSKHSGNCSVIYSRLELSSFYAD